MQESSTEEGTSYSASPLRPMTLFIEASMKISKIPREADHIYCIPMALTSPERSSEMQRS